MKLNKENLLVVVMCCLTRGHYRDAENDLCMEFKRSNINREAMKSAVLEYCEEYEVLKNLQLEEIWDLCKLIFSLKDNECAVLADIRPQGSAWGVYVPFRQTERIEKEVL